MKLAFTSCMSTIGFPNQPVWDQIRAQQPEHLVLTGDSIYIDTPPYEQHPKLMMDDAFARHLFARWTALLQQAQFRALVSQPQVTSHAIWDDHDFLWNEAYGEQAINSPVYRGAVRTTRAMFNAYCRALDKHLAPGSFPAVYNDPALYVPNEPAPDYRYRDLGNQVALHLTDGRSYRVRSILLGEAQRRQIEQKIAALPPDTVHLIASGSVVEDHKGDAWSNFDTDYEWLCGLARSYKILVLSGDIHKNRFDTVDAGNGRLLFDASASGAAVRRLVTLGSECQNYGLLDITPTDIGIALYSFGTPDKRVAQPRINRGTWQLV